jgi:phosphoribosylamine---glycine ligase
MKILFISEDLVAGNIAYMLTGEGHDVRLYIKDLGRRDSFENMVKKTDVWEKNLSWVGKNGLVVFDSGSHGQIQDRLRRKGYLVVGGSNLGNKLENDREFGYKTFRHYGIKTVPLLNFPGLEKAISFVKKKKGKWVVKQNSLGTGFKNFNYVGLLDNGRDVIDVLENYQEKKEYKNSKLSLQKKIAGVEIGVGRYFNGNDWVGPIEINLEHKKLFPGDLGPTTSEMGTLAWYDNDEKNKLFQETLGKLRSFLIKSKFIGDIEINCIVNENGAFPLEATARFGSPIIHLQSEIHISPWGEFLKSIAEGKSYNLKWKKGYGIVVVVTVPTSQPFPFTKQERYISPKGINIYFDKSLKEKDFRHIHFEDVSMKKVGGKRQLYISDDRGYVLYVTSIGKTVEEARKKAYALLKKIYIPKMFYRNDIGLKFINEDEKKLRKWGYL